MRCNHATCEKLLSEFDFRDIRAAEPPDQKGVYVIRVVRQGEPIDSIMTETKELTKALNFPIVSNFMTDRIDRLKRIGQCPIIYIGSAGSKAGSKNTLKGRYKEFAGRHTIMYPIWALLFFGWELEYGYTVTGTPADQEDILKDEYKKIHGDNLPALVNR